MRMLERLRAETAEAHEDLDRRHEGGQFVRMEDYGRFLEAQARIFPAAEDHLAASAEFRTLSDWSERLRAQALMSDLKALGRPDPTPIAFRFHDRPGVAAGIAYVLEGSRLGGKLIARKLEQAGLGDAPVAFLTQGADRRFWPSFTRWLESREADETYAEDAAAAARATFSLFLLAIQKAAE